MHSSGRHRRSSWIAPAAIWVALLATAGMAEASVTGGRQCDAPAPKACCVARPETRNAGCCPPAASALTRTGIPDALAPAGMATAQTGCLQTACQCRSGEPVTPAPKPDRRTTDDRSDQGETLSASWLGHSFSSAPADFILTDAAGRLNSPPYVLTTHLRF
jgi:hypothetical protein